MVYREYIKVKKINAFILVMHNNNNNNNNISNRKKTKREINSKSIHEYIELNNKLKW